MRGSPGPKSIALLLLCCTPAVASAQEKFALSMFHFNIQYVAGGLEGTALVEDHEEFQLDDRQVQDLIVNESLEPVLDLYLRHPDWKVTLEMQGYMADVLRERHPAALAKLHQLNRRGQLELVSFHWSAQLYLAYPAVDMERSQQLLEQSWARAGLPVSPVVFNQEGQFGEGMVRFAARHGRRIVVLPKNLLRYQHASAESQFGGLFEHEGLDVIWSRSISNDRLQAVWTFFNDGELLATNDMNPYAGPLFRRHPPSLEAYEEDLERLVQQGFRIASISEMVDWARKNEVPREPLPAMLDGTWQPGSTDSMHRWMGARGLFDLVYENERDNQVLTGNVRAGQALQAAEALVTHAERQSWFQPGARGERLERCWRELLLAEVSDASGINPIENEVRYGLEHGSEALRCAERLIAELAPRVGAPQVAIDTATGAITGAEARSSRELVPIDGPAPLEVTAEAEGREVALRWERAVDDPALHRLTVEVGPGELRGLTLRVPWTLDAIVTTSGLIEDEVRRVPLSELELEEERITLPLANGLAGIGPELWLVKQTSTVHVGATFDSGAGQLRFVDKTLEPDAPVTWVLWLLRGSAQQALDLAREINLHPVIWAKGMPAPAPDDDAPSRRLSPAGGGGCAIGGSPAGWPGVLLLLGLRRRLAARRPC